MNKFCVTEWLNFLMTENASLLAFEHSTLSEIVECLKDLIPSNLDRKIAEKIKYLMPCSKKVVNSWSLKSLLSPEFDSVCLTVRDDGLSQWSTKRPSKISRPLKSYSYLDSTDGDVVAELVGALKTNDLVSITEWEHSDKDAIGHPNFAAMIFACGILL